MRKVTKQDILESSGSLQVCAGHKSGSEAAVHAMNSLFQTETEAVLLLDASNAFNSLNRPAAFHNIRVHCPADNFNVDQAMICKRGVFVIQRHNELGDLETELLRVVYRR